MMFMAINTWEPNATKELWKRLEEEGFKKPEGFELVAYYGDLGGGRSFSVFETDDPQAIAMASMMWNDLMKSEIVPIGEPFLMQ